MIYNFNNISPKFDKESWYAPNSVLIGDVTLKDANIWFNATLRGDVEPIVIGEGSNIQDGSCTPIPVAQLLLVIMLQLVIWLCFMAALLMTIA